MDKKVFLRGFAVLSFVASTCFASQHHFLRDLGEFDASNYTNPKSIGLSVGGAALLVGGLVALTYATALNAYVPEAVTRNVQTIDIAETVAALGGLVTVCAGFSKGKESLVRLAPTLAQTAFLKQYMVPNHAERHELLGILGAGVGVASVADLSEWASQLLLDKEDKPSNE